MVSPMPGTLEIKGASVRRVGRVIIDGINARVALTGTHVILGPNGAGKSTLLRALHGMERLNAGSIEWPRNPNDAPLQRAYVFQTPIVLRRTVLGNLVYPLNLKKVAKQEAETKAHTLAERFGLTPHLDTRAERLSGGEKQVLALARALAVQPDILILDEPTTNLDGPTTRLIEETVTTLSRSGTTIFLATHDLGQARRLADHILFLNRGQLVEASRAKPFFDNPQTLAARSYLRGDIVE